MNKRLALLEQMTQKGNADAFTTYALALEYKGEGRTDDALRTFESLREREPSYLPMYLMAGQMLIDLDRHDEAVPWLQAGAALAREQGNGQALGELEAALQEAEG